MRRGAAGRGGPSFRSSSASRHPPSCRLRPGSLGSPLPGCSRGSCVGGLGRRLCARPAPRRPGLVTSRAHASPRPWGGAHPPLAVGPGPGHTPLLPVPAQPPGSSHSPCGRPGLSCELPWRGVGGRGAGCSTSCLCLDSSPFTVPPPRRLGCWSHVHVCPLGPLGGAGAGLTPPLAGAARAPRTPGGTSACWRPRPAVVRVAGSSERTPYLFDRTPRLIY